MHLLGLREETLRIRVELKGYQSAEGTVRTVGGKEVGVTVNLKPSRK